MGLIKNSISKSMDTKCLMKLRIRRTCEAGGFVVVVFWGCFIPLQVSPPPPFQGRSIYSKQPRSKTLVHMQEPNKSPFCWGWVTCVNPCHPATRARQRGGWNGGAPAEPAPRAGPLCGRCRLSLFAASLPGTPDNRRCRWHPTRHLFSFIDALLEEFPV